MRIRYHQWCVGFETQTKVQYVFQRIGSIDHGSDESVPRLLVRIEESCNNGESDKGSRPCSRSVTGIR
eukprot:m.27682 g.27682  ORF g.27682 m.27682 type:complete len:68 (-) comp8963_c1_seq1:20-223(-)